MARYILHRLLILLPVLILVSVFCFSLLHLIPGDPIDFMFSDEDLDDAAKEALRQMIGLITQRTNLSKAQAYSLCSLTADLRVTQIVNGNKGIHAIIPKSVI